MGEVPPVIARNSAASLTVVEVLDRSYLFFRQPDEKWPGSASRVLVFPLPGMSAGRPTGFRPASNISTYGMIFASARAARPGFPPSFSARAGLAAGRPRVDVFDFYACRCCCFAAVLLPFFRSHFPKRRLLAYKASRSRFPCRRPLPTQNPFANPSAAEPSDSGPFIGFGD
jgi:hypothetical protein